MTRAGGDNEKCHERDQFFALFTKRGGSRLLNGVCPCSSSLPIRLAGFAFPSRATLTFSAQESTCNNCVSRDEVSAGETASKAEEDAMKNDCA